MTPSRRRSLLPLTSVLLATALSLPIGCRQRPPADSRVVGVFGETGVGHAAFSYPRAVVVSPQGKVFVVDKTGRIQRFSADGEFELAWRMPDWEKGKPVGMTLHPDGRLFVADTHYHRVMIFSQDGELLEQFGSEGTGDGEFLLPTDIAFDADGNVYVAEYGGNDRISKFTPDLNFVTSFGEPESGKAALLRPTALAFDVEQRLWVADGCNHRICRFTRDGEFVRAFGTVGSAPGQLRYPYDLDIDDDGLLVVAEYGNNRIQWFDADGNSKGVWGTPGREPGQLAYPWAVQIGPKDRLYIVDSGNNRVQILKR